MSQRIEDLISPYLKFFRIKNDPETETKRLIYTGPEPKDDREAILMSIAKWRVLLTHANRDYIDGGPTTCGLCIKYFLPSTLINDHYQCIECPVYRKTGKTSCKNTPYHKICGATSKKEYTRAIREEIFFLKSLLEG